MKDKRGIDIKVGDSVVFGRPLGFGKRELEFGEVVKLCKATVTVFYKHNGNEKVGNYYPESLIVAALPEA